MMRTRGCETIVSLHVNMWISSREAHESIITVLLYIILYTSGFAYFETQYEIRNEKTLLNKLNMHLFENVRLIIEQLGKTLTYLLNILF